VRPWAVSTPGPPPTPEAAQGQRRRKMREDEEALRKDVVKLARVFAPQGGPELDGDLGFHGYGPR
jgi:hypothetical protein